MGGAKVTTAWIDEAEQVNNRLTDAELAACKEKAYVLREMAERLGNDYSALNHEKMVRALTELQERRKADEKGQSNV